MVVRYGPPLGSIEPVVRVELGRVEALELLGMTLAHLNVAEAGVDDMIRVAHKSGASIRQLADVSGLGRKTVTAIVTSEGATPD